MLGISEIGTGWRRSARRAGTAIVVVGAVWWQGERSAWAYEPVRAWVAAQGRVAPNGTLVIETQCNFDCEDLTVTAEVAQMVEGGKGAVAEGTLQSEQSGDRVHSLWTPDEPLQPGERYQLTVFLNGIESGSREVVAEAEVEWSAPSLRGATFGLGEQRSPEGTLYCCESGYSGGDNCFGESEQVSAHFELLMLGENVDPESPYVYRLTSITEGSAVEQTGWAWSMPHQHLRLSFARPAQEYCALFEARNLLDGEILARDICLSAPVNVTPGDIVPTELTAEEWLSECPLDPPQAEMDCERESEDCLPESLLEPWCAAHREHSENALDTSADYRQTVAAYCGSAQPSSGANLDEDVALSDSASGCSFVSRGHQGGAWALSVLALAWVVRRRQK